MDEPELTPEEERVRRLLADARHTEPMPEDVAARLDRVLSGLAEEPGRSADVVSLASRRRRAGQLLVAAAAVVAIGIGVGQVVSPGGSGEAETTAEDAGSGLAGGDTDDSGGGAQPQKESEQEAGSDAPTEEGGPAGDLAAKAASPVRIQPERFAEDVAALRTRDSAALTNQSVRERATRRELRLTQTYSLCGPDAWGKGRVVPVRYGSLPGVVVLRKPRGDTQVADLFLCGDTVPIRSVTLPLP